MEFGVEIIVAGVVAYLLGSLPTAVWIGKRFFGIDIREHGSGNAGATNALRVLGNRIGLLVLFLDALKGALAVSLAWAVQSLFSSQELFVVFQLVLGGLALLGHVYPVFASFRGGKGIATLAGIIFVMLPLAVLVCIVVFAAVFIPTRYVSLGSLSAAVAFPVAVIWILDITLLPIIIFSFLVTVFVVLTHIRNIHRLLHGKENKISFRKTK